MSTTHIRQLGTYACVCIASSKGYRSRLLPTHPSSPHVEMPSRPRETQLRALYRYEGTYTGSRNVEKRCRNKAERRPFQAQGYPHVHWYQPHAVLLQGEIAQRSASLRRQIGRSKTPRSVSSEPTASSGACTMCSWAGSSGAQEHDVARCMARSPPSRMMRQVQQRARRARPRLCAPSHIVTIAGAPASHGVCSLLGQSRPGWCTRLVVTVQRAPTLRGQVWLSSCGPA
jgi:hypothetical protein